MEEDDEIQSHPSPTPNGGITVTVAAAPPSSNSLTLALPIQQTKTPGTGGGREDCWSEGATAVLIDAWGERYLELSRGNLKQKHWKDVAEIVSSRENYAKTPKTDVQCKNRIDTVKKKYKVEKAKIAAGGVGSKWRFFDKLDELIVPTSKMTVPMGIPVGVRSSSVQQEFRPQRQMHPKLSRKRNMEDSDDESEPENSLDSSDGLPPESYKKPGILRETFTNKALAASHVMVNKKSGGGNARGNKETSWGNSMRELSRAILKLGETYEQAETAKLQQLLEMEKQRMKFAKELELQRMQYFMKTQLELSSLKKRKPGNNNSRYEITNNSDANNNNSDTSN